MFCTIHNNKMPFYALIKQEHQYAAKFVSNKMIFSNSWQHRVDCNYVSVCGFHVSFRYVWYFASCSAVFDWLYLCGHTGRISIKIKEREGELKIPLRSEKKRSKGEITTSAGPQQQPRRNENTNTNCEYMYIYCCCVTEATAQSETAAKLLK